MRVVKYFPTREILDYQAIFDREGCVLCVLPRPSISIIRTFLRYAHRSINYRYSSIDDKTYTALSDDDAEFQAIDELLGETEGCLMSFCDLSDFIDVMEEIRDCVCAMSETSQNQDANTYLQNTDLLTFSETQDLESVELPSGDDDRCTLANTMFGYIYQQVSEVWLPLAEVTTTVLAFAIGITPTFIALSGGLGIAPALAAVLFSAAVAWLAEYATTNLTNWLLANRDAMVCEIYDELIESYQSVASALVEYINQDESLSTGDRMMLRFLFGQAKTYQMVQDAIVNERIDPDDYTQYECGECGTPTGCWTMAQSEWTIEACGTLEGSILTNGCSTNAILASRSATVSGNFELGLYSMRPYDDAYNFDLRVYRDANLLFQWRPITDAGTSYMSTTTTGVTAGEVEIRLYGVTGTPYEVHYVCAIES